MNQGKRGKATKTTNVQSAIPPQTHHASYKGIKHRTLSAMKRSERLKACGAVKIIRLCVGRTTGVVVR